MLCRPMLTEVEITIRGKKLIRQSIHDNENKKMSLSMYN